MRLTGECELSQRDVTVQAVIDEADADALGLHLHAGHWPGVAAGAGVGPASGKPRNVLRVLPQPGGRLVQVA